MTGDPLASKYSTHQALQAHALASDKRTSSQFLERLGGLARVGGGNEDASEKNNLCLNGSNISGSDPSISQELTSIDTVSSEIKSTPSKLRRGPVANTHPGVDSGFANDVTYNTSRGIPVPLFLCLAFEIKKPAFEKLTNEIKAWDILKSERFEELLDEFEDADVEKEMYDPFVEMGNMILDHSEKEACAAGSKTSATKKVHLVNSSNKALNGASASRSPDILLVTQRQGKSGKGNASETPSNHVDNTLVPFEFKFPKQFDEPLKRLHNDDAGVEIDAHGIAEPVFQAASEAKAPPANFQNTSEAGVQSSAVDSLLPSVDLYSRSEARVQAAAKHSAKRTHNHGRLQLAQYAAELLNARGDRSHVFGVRVNKDAITLTFYHRSAIIEADPFNLRENPEFLALFLTRFQGAPSSYGFNPAIGFHNPFNKRDKTTRQFGASEVLQAVPKDVSTTLKQELDLTMVTIGDVVEKQNCLIGRGTSVRDVSIPGVKKDKIVIKSTWQVVGCDDECDNIAKARVVIGRHAPEVYAKGTIPYSSVVDELFRACERPAHTYERRELRVNIMKKFTPLPSVLTNGEFYDSIVGIARCLHDSYAQIRMLHQDININNLAPHYDDDVFVVVLLDFDLASTPESTRRVSKYRTGTYPFMARRILDTGYPYVLKIYHDLESLFYCLVWHALGYRTGKQPPTNSLWLWTASLPRTALIVKKEFIESREKRKEACSKLDGEGWPWVLSIWLRYNKASENRREKPIDQDEIQRLGIQAREEALKSGKSIREAGTVFAETCERLYMELDNEVLDGLSITYKEWMYGAEGDIPTDLNCTCC